MHARGLASRDIPTPRTSPGLHRSLSGGGLCRFWHPAAALPDPLSAIPDVLTAGDTVVWNQSIPASEYAPGGDYGLRCLLAGPSVLAVDGTAVSGAWRVTLTAAQTAALTPGTYAWVIVVETALAAQRYTLEEGTLVVRPSRVAAVAGGLVSHAAQALPLLEAQYRELAAQPLSSYRIDEREGVRQKLADLRREIAACRREIARERNNGSPPGVTFSFARVS